MKNRKILFGTIILLFAITGICNISNVFAIDNPDYTETIPPGTYLELGIDVNKGDELRIEYEVISGGDKDVDFYIKDSDGNKVLDWGRVVGYGLCYFDAPYDDYFRVIFSNTFSIITSKVIEINLDIVAYGKSITIISPKTNDVFDNGYNYIDWSTTGTINYVRIELYYGNSFLDVIDSQAYDDGSYSWYLSTSDTYTEGSYYQIRISDYYDDTIYDFSDYFTIEIDEDYVDPYDTESDNFFLGWLVFIILPAIAVIIIVAVLVIRRKKRIPKEPIII